MNESDLGVLGAQEMTNAVTAEEPIDLLSVVTALYCSAADIEEFYRRVLMAAGPLARKTEIVFVNDGSPDESLEVGRRLHEADPRRPKVKAGHWEQNCGCVGGPPRNDAETGIEG